MSSLFTPGGDPPLSAADLATLHAYVDAELAPADRIAFEARLEREPLLARSVARERALRERLGNAWAGVLTEDVPERFTALLAGQAAAQTFDLDAERARRAAQRQQDAAPDIDSGSATLHPWRWAEWGGLAACLVVGLALGSRWLDGPGDPAQRSAVAAFAVDADGRLVAHLPLAGALETALSGTTVAGTTPGLSFAARDGRLCRSFVTAGEVENSGIACKTGTSWAIAYLERSGAPGAASQPSVIARQAEAASGATSPDAAGLYRTAASALSPSLLTAIDGLRAGDTLDAAAEEAARAKGWRVQR